MKKLVLNGHYKLMLKKYYKQAIILIIAIVAIGGYFYPQMALGARTSNFFKTIGSKIYPINDKTIVASGDLEFFDEIKPDGALCANGEILKKTGANNWDCAVDSGGSGGGGGGSSVWATSTPNIIYYNNEGKAFVIGGTATTSDVLFEVIGDLKAQDIYGTWAGTDLTESQISDLTHYTDAQVFAILSATTSLPNLDITESQISDLQSYLLSADIDTYSELDTIVADQTLAYGGGAFHDGFSDFVANEHIDWTGASAGTIHATNYVDNDTTYVSSDFTHDDLTGFVANEHIDWTSDQGATNIHSGNYTDTNTTYTAGGTLLDLTGTTFSLNEGTLTDTKYCTYESGTGIECNSDAGGLSASSTMATIDTLWTDNLYPTGDGTDSIAIIGNATGARSIAIGKSTVGGFSDVVALGYASEAKGNSSIAIGNNADVGSGDVNSIAIGTNSEATGSYGVAIGATTVAVLDSVAIGDSATSAAKESITIGHGSFSNAEDTIAIGHNANNSTANSMVIGGSGNVSNDYIDNIILGSATNNLEIRDKTIEVRSALGTNVVGGDLTIQSGESTGSGLAGRLIFSTSEAGGSGSSVNTATEKMTILSDGSVGIATSTPSYKLTVAGNIMLTGTIYDNDYSYGTNGQVLKTDGAGALTWEDDANTTYTGGTNLTLVGTTFNVDDAFIVNNANDTMTGVLTADGLTLGANENITLGSQTLDHDGTDFVFNDSVNITGEMDSTGTTTALELALPNDCYIKQSTSTTGIEIGCY